MKFIIYFVSLLFCCATQSIANSHSTASNKREALPAEAILSKSLESFVAKNYTEAVKLLQEYLSNNPPANFASFAYYYMGCSYAELGKNDKAMQALNSAAEKGFAEWEQATKEPTLFKLKNFDKFLKIIENFKSNADAGRIYQVTHWDNPTLGWFSLHYFSDYNHPKSKKLRNLYELEILVANEPTQLQKQLSAMNWVHSLWVHYPTNICASLDALSILDEVKAGKRFRCVEYAVVLSEVLEAIGFPARAVELNKEGMSFGVGKSHEVVEVWNDEYRKWIMLDPQNNAIWTSKDTILNAYEIHQLLLSKDTSSFNQVSVSLYPSKWRENQFNTKEWMQYFYYLSYRFSNRLLEMPEHPELDVCLVSDGQKPELLCQGFSRKINYTTSSKKIYPLLNCVHLDINPESLEPSQEDSNPNVLLCDFSNSAPWFDHYDVEINGEKTQLKTNSLHWKLNHGTNTLIVRSVNQAGLEGAPSTIEIIFYPPQNAAKSGL